MKISPTLRMIGVAMAIVPVLGLLIDSICGTKVVERSEFTKPFFIIVGVGVALAIVAQKNMPKCDAYGFEKSK